MSQCCSIATPTCSNTPAMERRVGICPECDNKGKRVQLITVQSLVRPDRHGEIQETQYHYCTTPSCDVVYYSARADLVFQKSDLTVRVGAKESVDPIPVCYCFGHTERSIRDEIEFTGKSSAEERIRAEIKAGRCACERTNPAGACCLGDVRAVTARLLRERAAAEDPSTYKAVKGSTLAGG